MAERSRIIKVAGLSFVGFCAASAFADKLPIDSTLTQLAGYCGAFAGAMVGRYGNYKFRTPAATQIQAAQTKRDDSAAQ